jgi:hypothetical protein
MASKAFVFCPSENWNYARGAIIIAADNPAEIQEIVKQYNDKERIKSVAREAAFAADISYCKDEVDLDEYPPGDILYEDFFMTKEEAGENIGWICNLVLDIHPYPSGIILQNWDVG